MRRYVEIPGVTSFLATGNWNAHLSGVRDLQAQLGDHDALALGRDVLDPGRGPGAELATAGAVRLAHAVQPDDLAAAGQVRPGDEPHEVLERGIRVQDELRAIEEIPGVLTRDGKTRVLDHALEGTAWKCRLCRASIVRRCRKFARGQRLNARLKTVRRDRDALASLVFRNSNLGFRQRTDDFEQLLRGKRQRSRL